MNFKVNEKHLFSKSYPDCNQNILGTCEEIDPDAPKDESAEDQPKLDTLKKTVNVSKYEKVESWTQTLDFSRKKKGTQCDEIEKNSSTSQVSTKNFLEEGLVQSDEKAPKMSLKRNASPKFGS